MEAIEPETVKIWKFKNGKFERKKFEGWVNIKPEQVIELLNFERSVQSNESYLSLCIEIYTQKDNRRYSDNQFLIEVSAGRISELILVESFPDFLELMSKLAPLGILFNTSDIKDLTECIWKRLNE